MSPRCSAGRGRVDECDGDDSRAELAERDQARLAHATVLRHHRGWSCGGPWVDLSACTSPLEAWARCMMRLCALLQRGCALSFLARVAVAKPRARLARCVGIFGPV
jgi:hypothetical protein